MNICACRVRSFHDRQWRLPPEISGLGAFDTSLLNHSKTVEAISIGIDELTIQIKESVIRLADAIDECPTIAKMHAVPNPFITTPFPFLSISF
jgi:hypothetical protein